MVEFTNLPGEMDIDKIVVVPARGGRNLGRSTARPTQRGGGVERRDGVPHP
jgi:hypothetical protein